MRPTNTKPRTRLTEASVRISVGAMFKPEWAEQSPALRETAGNLNDTRKAMVSLGRHLEKVEGLDPSHRTLQLDGMARAARTTLELIERNDKQGTSVLMDALTDLGKEARRELATVPGGANDAFAAAQIRDHVRGTSAGRRLAALEELLEDVEAVRAVLSAPPAATGLSRKQFDHFRLRAELRWTPQLATLRVATEGALEELRRSTKVARRMVAEASGLVERNGRWVAAWEMPEPDEAA